MRLNTSHFAFYMPTGTRNNLKIHCEHKYLTTKLGGIASKNMMLKNLGIILLNVPIVTNTIHLLNFIRLEYKWPY